MHVDAVKESQQVAFDVPWIQLSMLRHTVLILTQLLAHAVRMQIKFHFYDGSV